MGLMTRQESRAHSWGDFSPVVTDIYDPIHNDMKLKWTGADATVPYMSSSG